MKNVLFITVQNIKDRTGLHNNVDEKLILPEIMTAQDMFILPLLGSNLYKRLQDGIEADNLNAVEETLLDEYIIPTLVYYVLSELPMAISYQFYNKGLVRKKDDNTNDPDTQEIIDTMNRYKTRAEFYKQRTLKYLKAESVNDTYPQYNDTLNRYDDILPDKQAYTTSVYLPDEYHHEHISLEEKYQSNNPEHCE